MQFWKGVFAVTFTALGFIFDVLKLVFYIFLAPLVCLKLLHPLYSLSWLYTIAIPLVGGSVSWLFSIISFKVVELLSD